MTAPQKVIRTVPRRGFLFVPEVVPDTSAQTDPAQRRGPLRSCQNTSGDPEQTFFSDGFTDDIITDLSRYLMPGHPNALSYAAIAFQQADRPQRAAEAIAEPVESNAITWDCCVAYFPSRSPRIRR